MKAIWSFIASRFAGWFFGALMAAAGAVIVDIYYREQTNELQRRILIQGLVLDIHSRILQADGYLRAFIASKLSDPEQMNKAIGMLEPSSAYKRSVYVQIQELHDKLKVCERKQIADAKAIMRAITDNRAKLERASGVEFRESLKAFRSKWEELVNSLDNWYSFNCIGNQPEPINKSFYEFKQNRYVASDCHENSFLHGRTGEVVG